MDGLGAQARKVARAEPPPAGSDRHELRARERRVRRRPARRPLRRHARRGHPAAARSRQAPGRHDGASAQSTALRCALRPRRRRLRRAPATHHAALARRRELSLPAPVRGAGRDRSVRSGHVRRVPGPLRRGLVHRQGDLRRRRVRGGLDGPRPGERHAEPRPLRGRVRARRPRQRRRALRARPLALRRGLRASAPMGTRRLAAAAVDLRLGIPLDPGDRALEDARQPPAHPVGAGGAAHAGCRLDASGGVARRVDRVRPGDHRAPDASARAHRRHPARPRDLQAQPRACRRPGPRPRRLADGVRDDAAGVPGLADDRRDRADGGPRRRDPSQAAGMDDRGAGESRAAPGPARLLPADGRRRHPGLRRRGPQRVGSSGGVAHRAPVSPALGGVTGGRSLEQPAVAGRAHEGALGCGGARAQADRAPHLALLHDVRRRRRPCAASRQLPGGSEPRGRPPDVADESRALPAGHGGRARLRLARDRGHRRATRGDASDDDGSRALSRPLLQLVRHAGPARARSPLRLVGGQRKSRRASDHARPRLSRADRRSAPRRGAGRHRGRGVARPRIAQRAGGPRARTGGGATSGGGARHHGGRHREQRPHAGRVGGVAGRAGGRRPDGDGHRPLHRGGGRRERAARPRLGGGAARVRRQPPARSADAGAGAGRASRGAGRACPDARRRHGLHVPFRLRPQALLDRLSRLGRHARSGALRPAGLGGTADELPHDREG